MTRAVAGGSGRDAEFSYTFAAGPGAWRVTSAVPPGQGSGDVEADVLVVGEEVCFDREFRPMVSMHVAASYGLVEFDSQPWTCTDYDFGLNRMALFAYEREDPRWRIANLVTDDSGSFSARVARSEGVEGEPVLHVRTTGVTRDGPLDPARPAYDLWIDADHLPVRMETDGLRWDFTYPSGLEATLSAPASDERGSYGYAIGPGMGTAKACYHGGHCPEQSEDALRLTWGDGRTQPAG